MKRPCPACLGRGYWLFLVTEDAETRMPPWTDRNRTDDSYWREPPCPYCQGTRKRRGWYNPRRIRNILRNLLPPPTGTCTAFPHKVRYAHEMAALQAIVQQIPQPGKPLLRAYACRTCGAFHLSSWRTSKSGPRKEARYSRPAQKA